MNDLPKLETHMRSWGQRDKERDEGLNGQDNGWETGGITAGINLTNVTEEAELDTMHTRQKTITLTQETYMGN